MTSAGNTLREKQSGAFRIIEKSYSADAALALHEHETAYVSFLLAGAYVEVTQHEERNCSAGTVIWHPRAEAHADRFHSGGGHMLDLEIDPAWLEDAAQELKPVLRARMFRGGLPYSLGLRMYRELSDDSYRVQDVVTELLGFFFTGPSESNPPDWFNRALRICNDMEEQQVSLASLALAVGVHPVHVARSFRRFQGYTFGDHLTKIRIRKAFELLLNSKRPIVEVAYACGFADHAHLCRVFKHSTGLTPSAFRESVQSRLCKRRIKKKLHAG
ncbi:MAG TPA: helix-turn-helix transcriptional regulator [Terriglobales bacterium]|nr:helix-turn-helix transcriptional regulator [Terriglobales bacterium]